MVLTKEQKEINLKASKRKYYLKNKDKYKNWNNKGGFDKYILQCNDINELRGLIDIIENRIINCKLTPN
tara:strand:+ start:249 stop:455 length:207 start_codon:yes stop_codon:yes gene_type:complete